MTDPAHPAPGEHPTPDELVVLVDQGGAPTGTAPKATVHDAATPLHLGFSCHLLDSRGRVLVTRRALGKATWPGVWTNSVCGHPAPDESVADAVARRVRHELGAGVEALEEALPDFRYRAVDDSGVVENEVCPVFVGRLVGEPRPRPDEVEALAWAEPARVGAALRATPFAFSPWFVEEAALLDLYA